MLVLNEVRSGYASAPALHGVNLTITPGSRSVVLGRNGAGKSTLLKTIVGHLPLMSGRIELNGHAVDRLAPHERCRRGLAYVPQGRQIFGSLTVRANLEAGGYGAGLRRVQQAVDDVLDELPLLRTKLRDRGDSLSGGQQQILALGRALMTQPKTLLLDEPSEGIQPSLVTEIGDIVVRLNQDRGITVIMVEQNLDFAATVGDKAHIMEKGTIACSMPTSDFVADLALQHRFMGVGVAAD
ncbi:ABC transporter ATP-binding protein [Kribbella sp. NPDC050124]|uniref:ABC transporter ATP-binding protein n=1 Tax=Kribbella sp. NPDC050124 TaxID=3364114 RepID=UPI0037B828C9